LEVPGIDADFFLHMLPFRKSAQSVERTDTKPAVTTVVDQAAWA
jgi:hypothetical protein